MAVTQRVLVTGGGTLLGDSIASALLAEGAEVVLLVRPGSEDRLQGMDSRIRWFAADVWDPASLKGRARGCTSAVHTVGGLVADPKQGYTYQWLNFVSARNVANLCVSSGVPHLVLLSGVRALWVNSAYIAAKREAEQYLARVGLRHTIIRAPLVYRRGAQRSLFFALLTLLGQVPPFSWTRLGRVAPMPIDVLARGVARLTLEDRSQNSLIYAGGLRRKNSRQERRYGATLALTNDDTRPTPAVSERADTPFGWTPGSDR